MDPRWRGGDYYDAAPGDGPDESLSVARMVSQITFRSDDVTRNHPLRPWLAEVARDANVERIDLERQYAIVLRVRARAALRDVHAAPASKHQARMPFCACSRFSASSNTTERGESMTASVTSSPRCAGRQCMNTASAFALAKSASFTW